MDETVWDRDAPPGVLGTSEHAALVAAVKREFPEVYDRDSRKPWN